MVAEAQEEMRKYLKYAFLTGIVLALAIQVVRPARTNPAADPTAALTARVTVPAEVSAILDRSCRDCHSNATRWPWYTNVAPVSWWVIDHVNHGRSHFNYSEWGKYNAGERENLLKQVCELVRKGEMPLPSYLRMHDAKLSAEDVQSLCAFTDAVRSRPVPQTGQ